MIGLREHLWKRHAAYLIGEQWRVVNALGLHATMMHRARHIHDVSVLNAIR